MDADVGSNVCNNVGTIVILASPPLLMLPLPPLLPQRSGAALQDVFAGRNDRFSAKSEIQHNLAGRAHCAAGKLQQTTYSAGAHFELSLMLFLSSVGVHHHRCVNAKKRESS